MKNEETKESRPAYGKSDPADQYSFDYEPIRGYPELRWTGKRPFRNTMYFPAQLKESHGDTLDGWRNKIYWGDNLQVMSHLLREYRAKVRLIYIDPPFDSKADYKKKIELRGGSASSDASAFEENQYTDIWMNDEYLQFMYERLILMRELMAEDGTIVVHLDYHKALYLRCILDEVFGIPNFRNEIIVKRPISKNLQAQFESITALSCAHDNLFLYSKNPRTKYRQAWDKQEVKEEDGYWHRFWSGEDRPTMRYLLLGVNITTGQWKWEKNRAQVAANNYADFLLEGKKRGVDYKLVDYWREQGEKLEFLRKSETGTLENWFPPSDEKLASSLWLSCKAYENRKDYPTQKHEELLSLLIGRFSEKGDLIFDCFMGSGTTQAVAMKLGRRFLGADINLGAIQTTTKRLLGVAQELKTAVPDLGLDEAGKPAKLHSGFEVYTVNHYDFFRNELEARALLIEALEIQALPGNSLWDGELDGWMVKILAVNRLATAADLNPILNNLDLKAWQRSAKANPGKAVEKIRFVCLGHDPDLRAQFLTEMDKLGFKVELEILDILRDRQELHFKREAEAKIVRKKKSIEIKSFYPMNLLQKLSLEKSKVGEWRELVDSVLIDWNYDGAVFSPGLADIPDKKDMVDGSYAIPDDSGTIRVKITDLLAESWEGNVED